MTQSVELLLDPYAEALVLAEWHALHQAGLPSEVRAQPSESHRPHLTLYAGDQISPEAEQALPSLVSGLALPVRLGSWLLFGPHRERYILVHGVVVSSALLQLQERVALACGADPEGHFAPGAWTPHVTLAHRLGAGQLPAALATLATVSAVGTEVRITQCRRWDGTAREEWLL